MTCEFAPDGWSDWTERVHLLNGHEQSAFQLGW